MKKMIHWIVRKWKAFKMRAVGSMSAQATRIAQNENLPLLIRAIYASSGTQLIRVERKLVKEFLLYNPDMSDEFQKNMERIVRDSGL